MINNNLDFILRVSKCTDMTFDILKEVEFTTSIYQMHGATINSHLLQAKRTAYMEIIDIEFMIPYLQQNPQPRWSNPSVDLNNYDLDCIFKKWDTISDPIKDGGSGSFYTFAILQWHRNEVYADDMYFHIAEDPVIYSDRLIV